MLAHRHIDGVCAVKYAWVGYRIRIYKCGGDDVKMDVTNTQRSKPRLGDVRGACSMG